MITITTANTRIENCLSLIVVPEKALVEPGYIQTLAWENSAAMKHEFHAMAQMAYFQYQDGELQIPMVTGDVSIQSTDYTETVASGLILYRETDGGFHGLVHQGLNTKKLLEVAYRFCTRWVRLDI